MTAIFTRKRILPILLIVLLVGGGWWLYYTYFTFHIVSIDPDRGIFPTSQDSIRVTYNRPLAAEPKPDIKVDGAVLGSSSIDNSVLVIKLSSLPSDKQTVTVDISSITSKSGDKRSDSLRFVVAYVDYRDLSAETQNKQLAETDSFEQTHPLADLLPYEEDDFSISYDFPNSSDSRMPLFISSTAINYSDPLAAADSPSSLQVLRDARKAALAWLEKNGYVADKYILVFSEPYLLDEFGGVYVTTYRPSAGGE